MEYKTNSPIETFEIGKKIASSCIGGEIFALVGDLGAGKTTFVQGFAQYFGIERIVSPTFILYRKYNIENIKNIKYLNHLDFYRFEENISHEISTLGITDEWQNKDCVTLIEWADKASDVFPIETKWISFDIDGDSHIITIK